jgi:hypothetical protein
MWETQRDSELRFGIFCYLGPEEIEGFAKPWLMWLRPGLAEFYISFFFEKSIALKRAQRGATLGTLEVYKRVRGKGRRKKENLKN